ncbi:MAG: sulfatase-like hydrolase/transferase [Anaerolineaceae bacterium]|nr:sulfatase-like hydrolase/transferase [Anaerolineaceae bacterium]
MSQPSPERPNIIVFFTDQQRWDTTGVHGNPLGLTPNFDRAARQGTHIANAITPQPVCGPCRSVMQTGLYATETGCYRNAISLRPDQPTIAQSFNEADYKTGYIGKWHLADMASHGPVRPEQRGGYQYWLAANLLEFTSDAYDCRLYDGDGQEQRLPGYRVDAMTDAAIRYIDGVKDDNFFLFLSFLEPHHQNHTDSYPAPDGYEETYRSAWIPPDLQALGGSTHQHLAGYYGMVKRLDEAFGRLLDALKSMGIAENTVVIFTADHGNHFKTRNGEYKRSCHESSVHVPMAITGGPFTGGGHVDQLISLVDLPPTLLDIAGIDVPDDMQGSSFLPLVTREPVDWQDDVFIQISEAEVGRALRTQKWKYSVTAPDADPWEDSAADTYHEAYLYDLETDPYELFNLIGYQSHQVIAAELRQRLLNRIAAVEGAHPTIVPPATYTQFGQLSGSTEFPYFPADLTDPR